MNTYYTLASDRAAALGTADVLSAAEASIHSQIVTIVKAHVWRVGAPGTDMEDIAVDFPGTVASTNFLPAWFTAEVTLTAAGSYPGYKRYRTRVDRTLFDGPGWDDTYTLLLETFCDVWNEIPTPLCTRSGTLFTGMDPVSIPAPLQLSKAWYNRGTP